MTATTAALLGLVQGLTEFLPVSSSGHLVLLQHYFGVADVGIAFDVLLHLATMLAVVVYFRADLWRLVRDPRKVLLVVVSSIPAGIAGLALEDLFARLFASVTAVGVALLGTGFVLWGAERLSASYRERRNGERMSFADAWWIGLGQALAIVPGLSRSGTTIAAGLARGLERESAARFSFLLSVPVILGAGVLQVRDLSFASAQEVAPLAAGFLAAFASGLAAIRILLDVIRRSRLTLFSWYVWTLGAVVLLLALGGR